MSTPTTIAPTTAETIKLLNAWKAQHDALTDPQSRVFTIFGGNTDGIFFNTLWTTFDSYTHALARLLDCEQHEITSDLHWFWHECRMGATPHDAGRDGAMHRIDSIEALALLVTT